MPASQRLVPGDGQWLECTKASAPEDGQAARGRRVEPVVHGGRQAIEERPQMRSDVSAAATGCRAVDQVHSHQISSLDRRSQAETGAMAE